MPGTPHRQDSDPGRRRVAYLELIAATAILATIAVVLYLVFVYRPI